VTATATAVRTVRSRPISVQRPAPSPPRGGTPSSLDESTVAQVLAALPSLATWPDNGNEAKRLVRNTSQLLEWLQAVADRGWQARWQTAETLYGPRWRTWPVSTAIGSGAEYRRALTRGLGCLIKLRLVKPSYAFLIT
jgi:hypothetical protein